MMTTTTTTTTLIANEFGLFLAVYKDAIGKRQRFS